MRAMDRGEVRCTFRITFCKRTCIGQRVIVTTVTWQGSRGSSVREYLSSYPLENISSISPVIRGTLLEG